MRRDINQMHVSDSVAGRALTGFVAPRDIKHWFCRKRELSLNPSSPGGEETCLDNHDVRTDGDTN